MRLPAAAADADGRKILLPVRAPPAPLTGTSRRRSEIETNRDALG